MAQVHWCVSSKRDLREISEYIALDSPRHARRFVNRIRQAAESLTAFPNLGRTVPDLDDPTLREIIVRSYRVMYRVEDGDVFIAAVVHGARDVRNIKRDWLFD